MVPRERALLSRPGSEEGEALCSLGLFMRLISLERLGGGVGMNSAMSGDHKGGWLLKGWTAELPEIHLQHKSSKRVYQRK